jgi:serine O-acetyltransferase
MNADQMVQPRVFSFFEFVKSDAGRYLNEAKGRKRITMWLNLFFFVPGFQLAFLLRLQELVYKIPILGKIIRKFIWYFGSMISSSEINLGAVIGAGIYMPHPTGIVIRSECIIGRNVTILQGVTIGRGESAEISQTTIGDGCKIYAGAKIIGNVRIGSNAVIGANAVVLKDIPDGATAVGIPARVIKTR